jgi:catechol 2,3-dioxygenase-like lactoylglutathione lyase family enzyme
MHEVTIDNIGIGVSDVDRSLAFYERLGFVLSSRSERGATVALGACTLFLFPSSAAGARLRSGDPLANPPGLDHLSFAVDDIDAAHQLLTGAGLLFDSEPSDTTWGARAAALRDPDGTSIFLLSWRSAGITDERALDVLRRYLDTLQAHPSAAQMLAADIVTKDFETGFVDGLIWRGLDGLHDFLSQRDGFFDERHDLREILGAIVPLSDREVGLRTRLEFALRRWSAPSPTSEAFTGQAYHRWRLRDDGNGTWRVAAQLVERFDQLNDGAQRLFATPAEGLNR